MGWPLLRSFAACLAILGSARADVALEGTVSDVFTGQPLSGATVEVDDIGRPPRVVSLGRAATDEKGGYRLAFPVGVPLPRLRISAQAEGHCSDSVLVSIRVTDSGPFRLDFKLPHGAAVTGRVLDSSGQPVAGARLRIRGQVPEGAYTEDLLRSDPAEVRTLSGEAGSFRIWAPPGPRTIWVESDGRGGGRADVVVTGVEEVEVRLWPPREGSLRVLDAATRQPIPDVPVRIDESNAGWAEIAVTDEQGNGLVRDLPPGKIFAGADPRGYYDDYKSWAEGEETLVLELDSLAPRGKGTASISGVVVYQGDGKPVAGIEVSVGAGVVYTDEEGAFHVEGLAAGPVEVSAARGGIYVGGVPSTLTVDLGEGERREDVRMEIDYRPARIHGRVLGPDGAPAAGVSVALLSFDLEHDGVCDGRYSHREAIADLDGSFDLPVSGGSRYVQVLARHPALGGGHSKAYVAASLERRCPIEVRLVPGTPISGRLLDPEGRPIAGARVVAEDAYLRSSPALEEPWPPLPEWCVTDVEGFYGLVLPPGPIALRVEAPAHSDGIQRCLQIEPGDPPRAIDLKLRPRR